MPERPELDYVVPILDRSLRGVAIAGVALTKPVVLRLAVDAELASLLVGRRFTGVTRRAHFVRFGLDGAPAIELIVAPMLAGRFSLTEASARTPKDTALTFALADGRELRYRDDVQMGKVYVVPTGAHQHVPGYERVGVDVLDAAAFTRERFRALAARRRDQVKVFLLDKRALDALGNAYADEVLFAAGIHPKTWVRDLGAEDLDRLHDAIVSVLSEALATVTRRQPALDEKVRDFLSVRNRHKQPCPRCGTTIRRAGVRGHDAFFCPRCQPETRRTSIVDWRRTD